MARKYPQDVFDQAMVIVDGWAEINPELTFGNLTQAGLKESLDSVSQIESEIITLEAKLTNLRNGRDEAYEVIYGDDSSEYEMVGGTRYSDRKPTARKAATTA